MKNLYELYDSALRNGTFKYWDISFNGIEDLKGEKEEKDEIGFIKSYLGKGEKAELPIMEGLNHLERNRAIHIVSTFLLGIIIYERCEKIRRSIDEFLIFHPDGTDNTPDERFKYIWALITLYHDLGYAVEDKKVDTSKYNYKNLIKKFPKKPEYIPSSYSKNSLINYQKYRQDVWNCNDHGIIAGIMLYDQLTKLRNKKGVSASSLKWGEGLIYDFEIASWTIAVHNIYLIDKKSKYFHCYVEYKLSKFIYDTKARQIDCSRNPFLFLFCIVDSIEPLKRIKNSENVENIDYFGCLNEIKMEINDNSIAISFTPTCKLKDILINDINQLDNWLTDTQNCTIRI